MEITVETEGNEYYGCWKTSVLHGVPRGDRVYSSDAVNTLLSGFKDPRPALSIFINSDGEEVEFEAYGGRFVVKDAVRAPNQGDGGKHEVTTSLFSLLLFNGKPYYLPSTTLTIEETTYAGVYDEEENRLYLTTDYKIEGALFWLMCDSDYVYLGSHIKHEEEF